MRPLNNCLFQTFRRLDGARFLANLSTLADAPTKDQVPYRVLLVKTKGIVQAGDVVLGDGNRKILLMENAPDFEWGETYRAAYISRQYSWKRRNLVKNPISLVMEDAGLIDIGTIYAYFEKPQVIMFENNSETKYRFLTGQDVMVTDIIDGRNVKRVFESMGVKVVEIG